MNNKGLTLIELIVTFALALAIVIILINTLVIIKDNYNDTETRTNLVVNQSTLSNLLNEKFQGNNLVSYSSCAGTFCYEFTFKDGDVLELNVTTDTITFGKYVYKLDKLSEVVDPSLTINNPYLIIKIPIKTKTYPNEDFGINLVYKSG